MSSGARVEAEPAFLLHQRPYRNSSQLLECLSLHHGRVGLIAHGSRRIARGTRALLQPFRALHVSWLRRGELATLIDVEGRSAPHDLSGEGLLAGYYANELILSLTSRDDPGIELFAHYVTCLHDLRTGARVSRSLRLFEHRLLLCMGVGLQLEIDYVSGEPLAAELEYTFTLDSGARRASGEPGYRGAHLISLREERLDDADSLRAAKSLLGEAISRHLGPRRLKTRDVLRDIDARGLIA